MADDSSARLYQAFVSHDPAGAINVIERAKRSGVAQAQLFDQLFAPAMSLLGGAWANGAIDEYTFTQASVVAEQITSFVTPPDRRARHRHHRARRHHAPRPPRDRQGHHGRRAQRGGPPRHRSGRRRAPGRVPRACRGERCAHRHGVRADDVDREERGARARDVLGGRARRRRALRRGRTLLGRRLAREGGRRQRRRARRRERAQARREGRRRRPEAAS